MILLSKHKGFKMTDKEFEIQQQRFELFVSELEKISNKYKISLDCTGGVSIFQENSNIEITYDNDSSSGDLLSYIQEI